MKLLGRRYSKTEMVLGLLGACVLAGGILLVLNVPVHLVDGLVGIGLCAVGGTVIHAGVHSATEDEKRQIAERYGRLMLKACLVAIAVGILTWLMIGTVIVRHGSDGADSMTAGELVRGMVIATATIGLFGQWALVWRRALR